MNISTTINFYNICKMTQEQVVNYNIINLDKAGYKEVIQDDGFIFAKGEIPVLLVAHMDTVHKEVPSVINFAKDTNTISSPQGIGGDDRCGIYMIHEIIKTHKCHVLFTEDEEIGGVGVCKLIKSPYIKMIDDLNINYMIELDRKGNNDAVFYECNNEDFTDFILDKSGLKENHGSFTDICYLMTELGIAGVNISCGYYNAHQLTEYVNLKEMETQIKRVTDIINQPCEKPFEFIENVYDDYWGMDYYDSYFGGKRYGSSTDEPKLYYIEFRETKSEKGKTLKKAKIKAVELEARSEAEAIGTLLMDRNHLCYRDVELIYEQ